MVTWVSNFATSAGNHNMKHPGISRRRVLAGGGAVFAGAAFSTRVVAAAPPPEVVTPALIEAAKKEGKVIYYTSTDLPVAEKLAKEIGGQAKLFSGDVVKSEAVEKVIKDAASAFGGLDIVINNAGSLVKRTPYAEINDAFYDAVMDHGGSISAEHGIGVLKREELAQRKSPVALKLMRAIKQALDPHGRMNPGRVL